jgi:hypothetical protein
MTKSKSEEILARTVKIQLQFGTKDFMKLMNLAIWSPPPNKFPVLIKFDTAHMFILPAIQWEGGI